MGLRDKIVKMPKKQETAGKTVWKGPAEEGVTFSLLNQYLADRERFRLLTVAGLKAKEAFNHRIEYGNFWHVCEEAYNKGSKLSWADALKTYVAKVMSRFPLAQEQILHYYRTCVRQFEVFVKYQKTLKNKGEKDEYLFKEMTFAVPYKTERGNKVILRGKIDGGFVRTKDKKKTLWARENKTKGDIKEDKIRNQLRFDLQTMIYVVALDWMNEHDQLGRKRKEGDYTYGCKIGGVLYNVIRRPFSGGRGNITRHKAKGNKMAETEEAFYDRLVNDYIAKEPEYWFMQWDVELFKSDIHRFRTQCLDPMLDELVDWWASVKDTPWNLFPEAPHHYRMPFGLYSALMEGGGTVYDEFLETGSMTGLDRDQNLFPELT